MDEDILNGVRGLPRATGSNAENGRDKTQEAQEGKFPFAAFAHPGGCSPAGRDFSRSHSVAVSGSDFGRGFHLDGSELRLWKDLSESPDFWSKNPGYSC